MDPITLALFEAAKALLSSAMDVAVTNGLDEKLLKEEIIRAKESATVQVIEAEDDPQKAELILKSLSESVKEDTRKTFTLELQKVLKLAEQPNVETLSTLSQKHLTYLKGVNPETPVVTLNEIKTVLNIFVSSLKLNLLDQPTYRELYTKTELLRNSDLQTSFLKQSLDQLKSINEKTSSLIVSKARGMLPSEVPRLIGREEDVKEILDRIDITESDSNKKKLIIRGYPGTGKSSLARYLVSLRELEDKYPDCILWVRLGSSPQIKILLSQLARTVGIEVNQTDTPSSLHMRINSELETSKCIIVVDDIYSTAHFKFFNIGGEKSLVLVTTRSPKVAFDLADTKSDIYPLLGLSLSKARELFKVKGASVYEQFPDKCDAFLKRVDKLPLAIKVVSATLAWAEDNVEDIEGLLDSFITGGSILELEYDDELNLEDEGIRTIQDVLNTSISILPNQLQEKLGQLSLFAEGGRFELDDILATWNTQEDQDIQLLVNIGLLENNNGVYSTHSLIHQISDTLRDDQQLTTVMARRRQMQHFLQKLEAITSISASDNDVSSTVLLMIPHIHQNVEFIEKLVRGKQEADEEYELLVMFIKKNFETLKLIVPQLTLKKWVEVSIDTNRIHSKWKNYHLLNQLGVVLTNSGNYRKANKTLQKSFKQIEKLGDPFWVCANLLNIANNYERWQMLDKSLEALDKALLYTESLNVSEKILISCVINGIKANIYLSRGEYEEAIILFDKALDGFTELSKLIPDKNFTSDILNTKNNLGICFMEKGIQKGKQGNNDLLTALDYYKEALKVQESKGWLKDAGRSYLNMGKCLAYLGNREQSLIDLENGFNYAKAHDDKKGLAIYHRNVGIVSEVIDKDCENAVKSYLKAEEIATELDTKTFLKEIYEKIARCYEKLGLLDEAQRYRDKAQIISNGDHQ